MIFLSVFILLFLTIGSVSAYDEGCSFVGDNGNVENNLKNSYVLKNESIDDNLTVMSENIESSENDYIYNNVGNIEVSEDTVISNNSKLTNNSNLVSDYSLTNNSLSVNSSSKNVINLLTKSSVKRYVTIKQVCVAAAYFKKYYDVHLKFPKTVTVGKYKLTCAQVIYLMAKSIKQINSKNYKKILVIDIAKEKVYSGNLFYSNVKKATYLNWAKDTVLITYNNKYIPTFYYYSKLKVDYSTYSYAFAKILVYYKSHKSLPVKCSVKKITQTKGNVVKIGSNKYGSVQFIGSIGNTKSNIKIAYVIGVHVREYQAHDALWAALNKKASSLKCCYYVYKIKLAKSSGSYSTDRLRGQLLSKKFILPHAKKKKYKLLIDIHSSIAAKNGGAYKYNYFIFVPGNKNKKVKSWAKKIVSKSSGMVYFYPTSQTSPPYMTLPLLKSGTPTMVFETLTEESSSKSLSRLTNLVSIVDKLFI